MIDEWFRNETWTVEIKTAFFNKMQHAEHNMQVTALQIQGDILSRSKDEETQQAGIELLQMVITGYPDEIHIIAIVQGMLGDYYYKRAAFEMAETYLQSAVDFHRKFKRIGVIRREDLLLAETILLRKLTDRLEEALQLVINYPDTEGSLSEDYEQHYYYELLAHLYYQSGMKAEAANYANKAIEIAQNIELDFMLGKPAAIEKYYQQLPDLQQITKY
jgi:tetratricopeptide (TPR) repeat protein